MPVGAEEDDTARAVPARRLGQVADQALGAPGAGTTPSAGHAHHAHHHHDHPILLEPEVDRWRWRRKIRQNPRQLFFYRAAVSVAGLFFIAVGFVSGPLPGPGGIPLVLLGLAIWSSEFEWAHRLMEWFKLQLHLFRQWTRPQQTLFWVAFFGCCGLFGYLYLLALGTPGWMPRFAVRALTQLPGLD
jgi:uncharacterized protein (TIGR02611 family)